MPSLAVGNVTRGVERCALDKVTKAFCRLQSPADDTAVGAAADAAAAVSDQ